MTDKSLSLTLAILLLTGCSIPVAGTTNTTARIIDSAVQCSDPNQQQTVIHISNKQQLKQIASRLRGSLFPPPTVRLPNINFNRWHILYISSGQKPTAGYSLELAEPAFTVQQNRARLNVILNIPAPDAMVAAVITHPCMLVKLPRGNYTTIEVHGLNEVQQITVKKELSNRLK